MENPRLRRATPPARRDERSAREEKERRPSASGKASSPVAGSGGTAPQTVIGVTWPSGSPPLAKAGPSTTAPLAGSAVPRRLLPSLLAERDPELARPVVVGADDRLGVDLDLGAERAVPRHRVPPLGARIGGFPEGPELPAQRVGGQFGELDQTGDRGGRPGRHEGREQCVVALNGHDADVGANEALIVVVLAGCDDLAGRVQIDPEALGQHVGRNRGDHRQRIAEDAAVRVEAPEVRQIGVVLGNAVRHRVAEAVVADVDRANVLGEQGSSFETTASAVLWYGWLDSEPSSSKLCTTSMRCPSGRVAALAGAATSSVAMAIAEMPATIFSARTKPG